MKHLKELFAVLWIVALIMLIGFSRYESSKNVVQSTQTTINKQAWGPIVSDNINQQPIQIFAGSTRLKYPGYMEKNMEIMIPLEDITRSFSCSASLYDDTRLFLQKKDVRLEFINDQTDYSLNGVKVESGIGMTTMDGICYVPVSVLAEHFQCDYIWDVTSNELRISDHWEGSIVPGSYSLADDLRTTEVKNQGNLGTCWAVAATGALETTLRPKEIFIFSADHMSIRNSFTASQDEGGEYTMAMAYLAAWQGPVLEQDDPYGDKKSPQGLTAVKHVQEIQLIKEKDLEKIKEAVFLYGAVESSIYTSLRSSASRSVYYNRGNASYCYTGAEVPNHDIIIIGWDDSYSRDNFNMKVEGDGAFICQNSWGSKFGKDGIFYVSYYDSNIGTQSVVYSRIDDVDNYDCIYQTDLSGWAGQLGYNKETAYFANVFSAESKEEVQAVGFYATDKNTSYEISVAENFLDTSSLNGRTLVAAGTFESAGYYTVDLNSEIIVEAGQRFAIIIKIKTPNSIHPIAVEYNSSSKMRSVDLSDGEGYISIYGVDWSNTETEQSCNVCMKIYTDKVN